MNTLHYYMTRTTLTFGAATSKKMILVSPEAMFDLASKSPVNSKFEFKLLGVGLPTIRIGRRLFHTQAQAASYEAGYYYRSTSAAKPALDDFRDMGLLDADSDNEYREAAMYDNNVDY